MRADHRTDASCDRAEFREHARVDPAAEGRVGLGPQQVASPLVARRVVEDLESARAGHACDRSGLRGGQVIAERRLVPVLVEEFIGAA